MIKRFFFFLLALVAVTGVQAQDVPPVDTLAKKSSGLRVSLLTCAPGYDEIYEIFGHTAIRIVDSNETGEARDLVYNYGMFNGYEENYEIKFMRGKLLYYVATNLFGDFMDDYGSAGRGVEEQVLLLGDEEKVRINAMLKENLLPQNMYYKYDFFFDNCATRIRDMFQDALGKNFVYGETRPKEYKPTFRDIINRYFYSKHWERVGVNILLGSRIDKVMTNDDIMFLPNYLRDGLAGAKLDGKPAATPPQVIVTNSTPPSAGTNWAMVLTCTLLLLTILGLYVKQLRLLGRFMSILLLFVTGLLGCLVLVMWFGTNHQGCSNNFNLMWVLPLNIYIAFANPKGKGLYSLIAMILIVASLLLHVLHVQGLVVEFVPVLLSLLLIHGANYRKSKATQTK